MNCTDSANQEIHVGDYIILIGDPCIVESWRYVTGQIKEKSCYCITFAPLSYHAPTRAEVTAPTGSFRKITKEQAHDPKFIEWMKVSMPYPDGDKDA